MIASEMLVTWLTVEHSPNKKEIKANQCSTQLWGYPGTWWTWQWVNMMGGCPTQPGSGRQEAGLVPHPNPRNEHGIEPVQEEVVHMLNLNPGTNQLPTRSPTKLVIKEKQAWGVLLQARAWQLFTDLTCARQAGGQARERSCYAIQTKRTKTKQGRRGGNVQKCRHWTQEWNWETFMQKG